MIYRLIDAGKDYHLDVDGRWYCVQVYRDKEGKRVSLEELKAQQAAAKKPVAETPEWGGGMAQKRQAEERRQQLRAEAAQPFARRRYIVQ